MIGAPELTAGLLLAALTAYVLTGGADFGGGVWDLLASGPRREQQRTLIAQAIAPIWEANHVWLIFAVVICFTGFPAVYAILGTILHIPLALVLVGIVCRGTAFIFRGSGSASSAARHRWGRAFAIASTITPLLLGSVVGAVASGAVGKAHGALGTASFGDVFVAPWLAVFPMLVGLLAVAMFALLAATYLTVATADEPLREDFRRRALAAAGVVLILGAVGLLLHGERGKLPIAAGVAAVIGIWALWRRRFVLARSAVGAQVSLILWGWAATQYPYLVPDTFTIRSAAAPRATLLTLLGVMVLGAAILIPSLRYLMRLFASRKSLPD